jgi:hypothetical protein
VLYGAVVLFGLGPASPAALGTSDGQPTPVVRVPHDAVVPGPAQRLPQVSPGPVRHRVQRKRHRAAGDVTFATPPSPLAQGSAPTATTGLGLTPPRTAPTQPFPSVPPVTSLPVVAPAIPDVAVPAVDVPEVPTLQVPPLAPPLPSPPLPPVSVSLP